MDNPTQEQLTTFVNNNVTECQSSLVEHLLAKDILQYDDINNAYQYICPKCGYGQNEAFDSEQIDASDESFMTPCHYRCYECNEEFENEPQNAPQEILEWWICSDWLLEKLEAHGEAVLHTDFGSWWGRTCSGQAIMMDGVIERIYISL